LLVTTVAFVTYRFAELDRRVGPMSLESADSMAKEVSRKPMVSAVAVEEWVCLRTRKIENPA
jgi:hypothetical protein